MDNKYYFIRYLFANTATCKYEERSNAISMHPFDWTNENKKTQDTDYLLLDYKEITYEDFKKWFNGRI